jgi:hypothetical protein
VQKILGSDVVGADTGGDGVTATGDGVGGVTTTGDGVVGVTAAGDGVVGDATGDGVGKNDDAGQPQIGIAIIRNVLQSAGVKPGLVANNCAVAQFNPTLGSKNARPSEIPGCPSPQMLQTIRGSTDGELDGSGPAVGGVVGGTGEPVGAVFFLKNTTKQKMKTEARKGGKNN